MAVTSLEIAIKNCPGPIYVYHEIVHNQYVVKQFTKQGAIFVNSLEEIQIPCSPTVFRLKYVERKERKLFAIRRDLPASHQKVHLEAIKYAKEGYTIILIGHEGHDGSDRYDGQATGCQSSLSKMKPMWIDWSSMRRPS